ncbi:helix-turn-helix transcriptional regulator [Microcella sp.]|uniref:helix-turn-helix transcriptional regulator n=1 Tax=Microcella sp. TaxID=1913979 RepID=UPI003918A77D
MPTAADTIRTARTRARLSQSALARRAGVAQSTVSRIESDDLDPTWSTMQSLLQATGWAVEPIRTEVADLLSASTTSRAMSASLRRGDQEAAIRDLTEAVGRLIRFGEASDAPVPAWVTDEPRAHELDPSWGTYLATAFAYALERTHRPIAQWMLDSPALPVETAVGDDPSTEFRAWLRAQTPPIFLSKNLLSRPADWTIA